MIEELFIDAFSFDQIAELEGKKVRCISGAGLNPILRDVHLKSISGIIGLEELDLEWAGHITDRGVGYLKEIKTLRYIDLNFCYLVTETAKQELLGALPDLVIE